MPAASSIYWNSQDSQRSSGEGSEPRSSSSSSGDNRRRYVDPWDLENYAYLRRRQNQIITLPRTDDALITRNLSPNAIRSESSSDSYYWYPANMPVMREPPGYAAGTGTTIEELYLQRPSRQMHSQANNYPYPVQQPSYEDEARYVTPNPVYVPLSEIHPQLKPELDMVGMRRSQLDYNNLEYSEEPPELEEPKLGPARRNKPIKTTAGKEEEACLCPYHGPLTNAVEPREVRVTPPKQLGLNTYGHLRIDYTKSWNSLHRKMKK